jgi:hypothetical protein
MLNRTDIISIATSKRVNQPRRRASVCTMTVGDCGTFGAVLELVGWLMTVSVSEERKRVSFHRAPERQQGPCAVAIWEFGQKAQSRPSLTVVSIAAKMTVVSRPAAASSSKFPPQRVDRVFVRPINEIVSIIPAVANSCNAPDIPRPQSITLYRARARLRHSGAGGIGEMSHLWPRHVSTDFVPRNRRSTRRQKYQETTGDESETRLLDESMAAQCGGRNSS